MAGSDFPWDAPTQSGAEFQPTAWTDLRALAEPADPVRQKEALERICRCYWKPIYAFIRRRGQPAEAARDLTQDFFHHLLRKERLKLADQRRGRFRSFVLRALQNFLASDWDRRSAQKRDERVVVSLDEPMDDSGQPRDLAGSGAPPDEVFDRLWALDLLAATRRRLEQSLRADGKDAQLRLVPLALSEDDSPPLRHGRRRTSDGRTGGPQGHRTAAAALAELPPGRDRPHRPVARRRRDGTPRLAGNSHRRIPKLTGTPTHVRTPTHPGRSHLSENSVSTPRMPKITRSPQLLIGRLAVFVAVWLVRPWALDADSDRLAELVWIREPVQVLRAGAGTPDLVSSNLLRQPLGLKAGDQIRTLEHGRAALRLNDGSVVELRETSHFRVGQEAERGLFELLRGFMSFFHRGEPAKVKVQGNGVSALVLGTEFTFAVGDEGTAELVLFDGEVHLTNAVGGLRLLGGEIARAEAGGAPRRTAVLAAESGAVQWLIYYPGVLAPAELWPGELPAALAAAFDRYRAGDLPGALRAWPPGLLPRDDQERVFRAALLLGSGEAENATALLATVSEPRAVRLADALRTLVSAVQSGRSSGGTNPAAMPAGGLASQQVAESYARQARLDLSGALAAASAAAAQLPDFGFAWARVAELEFSFGRIRSAKAALARALTLAPANAQAVALHGFLLAAEHRTAAAEAEFERALTLDPALGNAWLGRGLTRIRQGRLEDGRADLLQAAAVEPNRSLLRSYLGKAFALAADPDRAAHELGLARRLDSADPTAWLYGALLHQQRGEVNEAIRAYAEAESRNGSRSLYRSGLLLDQDRAVVNANRAAAYRDAGLGDFAVREAGRALSFDPVNAPAHLFLAEGYLATDRVNLRHETPRVAEYLQANLLAPVGGGVLSANLSQQDYARLFERDGLHAFSQTAYQSRGAWEQAGGLFGTDGRVGYLADAHYTTDPGTVPNADFEQTVFDVQLKAQVGARDSLYVQALHSEVESGDLASYTDPANAHPSVRIRETLAPLAVAGWHRAWSPEHHTLFLAGWTESDQRVSDPDAGQSLFSFNTDVNGRLTGAFAVPPLPAVQQEYRSRECWFTGEAQHLWHTERNTFIAGVRYQHGDLTTRNALSNLPPEFLPFPAEVTPDAERFQGYAYETVRPWESLAVTAGLSFDALDSPRNFRAGPLAPDSLRTERWSPKAGLVWTIRSNLWLRGAYTRSLGGVGYEQSFRLEPTLVGGFNQAFRSLIPESLAGSLSGARHETWQVALEARPTPDTLLALQAEQLNSEADAWQGIFVGIPFGFPFFVESAQTPVNFAYEERAITFAAARLLGRNWSAFARYRFSLTELDRHWLEAGTPTPGLVLPPAFGTRVHSEATLHTTTLGFRYNHSGGWFAGAEAAWYFQPAGHSTDYDPAPRESTWQVGMFLGYRFWQRRAELQFGLENLLNQDYRLHPLGGAGVLPRERTAVVRLKWVW